MLAVLLFAGCGPTGEETDDSQAVGRAGFDLLAGGADRLIEQRGTLVPDAYHQWGPNGLRGWSPTTLIDSGLAQADGTGRYAHTNQPEASLLLFAVDQLDREIELTAWRIPGGVDSPGKISASLNGIALTSDLELGTSPQEVRLLAPSAAWREGENVLSFTAPVFTGASTKAGVFDSLALASISFGPDRLVESVERDAATSGVRLRLRAGTGLRYSLEPRGKARLRVEARVEADSIDGPSNRSRSGAAESESSEAALELRWAFVDPETGAPAGSELPPRPVPVQDGRISVDVPLPDRGDSVLQLELVWRGTDGSSLALSELRVEESVSSPRPPIVFISIDTFSARHMAAYGYGRVTTPNIDALLDEAVLFERCVVNAPWTAPSYMSVLSGLYPRAHYLEPEGPGAATLIEQWLLADNRWTLSESLRARGYATAGFVDTYWLDERFGVDQGFDLWDAFASALPFEHPSFGVAYVTRRAHEWLRRPGASRAPFLFLHALDAHGPYLPELPYLGTFEQDLPGEPCMVLAGADYQAARAMPEWMAKTVHHGTSIMTQADYAKPIPRRVALEPIVARYDEALLKVDGFIGPFLDSLRSLGIWDEAVVVVTGDHGEAFRGEYYGHARLYQEILEVPLIIKLPSGKGAGTRIPTGVQLVDLFPTLLELASGERAPAWAHGRSLLPLIEAGGGDSVPLFSEGGHHEGYVVIIDDWKLVESYPSRESGDVALLTHPLVPPEWLDENFPSIVDEPLTSTLHARLLEEPDYARRVADLRRFLAAGEPYRSLYHLLDDPGELVDLAASEPERIQAMLPALEAARLRAREAQSLAEPGLVRRELSEEAQQALTALGYGPAKKH